MSKYIMHRHLLHFHDCVIGRLEREYLLYVYTHVSPTQVSYILELINRSLIDFVHLELYSDRVK